MSELFFRPPSRGDLGLPILYFTQLMGLAFGLKVDALGLDKHFVDPVPLLQQVL